LIRGRPPWLRKRLGQDWSTADDIWTAEWLQHHGVIVSSKIAAQAVEDAARDRRFHPVRDYLDELTRDGSARLDSWAIDFLGAEDTPLSAPYARASLSLPLLASTSRDVKLTPSSSWRDIREPSNQR
jgi:predicted P-loop ATPase